MVKISDICALSYCIFVASAVSALALEVTNFENNERVGNPLVMLRGDTGGDAKSPFSVCNISSKKESRKMEGLVSNGRFKAFAELVPGKNVLELSHGGDKRHFNLDYTPQSNPYKVRAVFYTDSSGDTTYESQLDEAQDYKAKWDAALKLLQCYTAEWMHRNGHGRRTFNLELDQNGEVVVNIIQASRGFDELQAVDGNQAFQMVYRDIHQQLPEDGDRYKNLVQVAWSRHNHKTGQASGYAALGGGGVALMGGACFYTWPSGVKNIQKTFMSEVLIDSKKFHADGGDAIFKTAGNTLGASLHELGHAFGLPHTNPKVGLGNAVMFYGYQMNRYATFADPPWGGNGNKWSTFDEKKEFESIYLSKVSCAALVPTRFFSMVDREYSQDNSIKISLDESQSHVVVRSNDGLAFVCAEIPGAAERFKQIGAQPLLKEFRMPIKTLVEAYETDKLTIRVVDWMGHLRHESLDKLIRR